MNDTLDSRHAIVAGSFDPITIGHTGIIERASRLYDRVTVAIGNNPSKHGLFDVAKRQQLIEASIQHDHVGVAVFEGLLVDFARTIKAGVLVRGLRLLADFEHEFQLALANRKLCPNLETVFMMTEPGHVHVSSSLVKEIAMNGGDVAGFVPDPVRKALMQKFSALRKKKINASNRSRKSEPR